jgi:hypothetical protein
MAGQLPVEHAVDISFFYDLHRLDVGLSRAEALAVVVMGEEQLDAAVRTPKQLRQEIALCRLIGVPTGVRSRRAVGTSTARLSGLPGVEEFDAGADEVSGVARGQRGGVRATDCGDLCVEGVDGASATFSCRCDVAVQSGGGSVEGEDLAGEGPEHLVGELPQLHGTPPIREPRETEADLGHGDRGRDKGFPCLPAQPGHDRRVW